MQKSAFGNQLEKKKVVNIQLRPKWTLTLEKNENSTKNSKV
jgi:hypothetical protein